MKKIISLILVSMLLITLSISVFAADSVLGDDVTTITGNEYNSAQNNETNNDTDNTNNKNTTTLPQTGAESYGIGLLLVLCIGSTLFAYKKISDYRNV